MGGKNPLKVTFLWLPQHCLSAGYQIRNMPLRSKKLIERWFMRTFSGFRANIFNMYTSFRGCDLPATYDTQGNDNSLHIVEKVLCALLLLVRLLCQWPEGCWFKSYSEQIDFAVGPWTKTLNLHLLQVLSDPVFWKNSMLLWKKKTSK